MISIHFLLPTNLFYSFWLVDIILDRWNKQSFLFLFFLRVYKNCKTNLETNNFVNKKKKKEKKTSLLKFGKLHWALFTSNSQTQNQRPLENPLT